MTYWFKLILNSQRKRIYWGAFWAFFTAFSGVALLALSGWFITATAIAGVGIAAGFVVRLDLYVPGSGIRFFALSRTIGRYTERIYNHDTILKLISVFRVRLFKRLSTLPLQQLRKTADSEWLSKLTADLDALDNILIRFTVPVISTTLLILTLALFLSFIHLPIALFITLFLFLSLAITIHRTIRAVSPLAQQSAGLLCALRAQFISHLQGAFVLQAQHMMAKHEQTLLAEMDMFNSVQQAINSRLGSIQLALDLALGFVLIALVGFSFLIVDTGAINGPVAVMLVMLFLGISELIQSLPSQFSAWGKTLFSSTRLKPMFEPTRYPQGERTIDRILSVALHLDCHPKVPVSCQSPIALHIEGKQLQLVLGRSGSGKSTLANLLAGIELCSEREATVYINSTLPVQSIKPTLWHNALAYLEQSNMILSGSLRYNLNIGLNPLADELILQALESVELKEWALKLPNGLDTWLGETGGQLSGGQARRICLSRLLLRNPQLVLLDEPFNGIDAIMAKRIWTNITPWLSHRATVLFQHEKPDFLNDQDVHTEVCLDPKT